MNTQIAADNKSIIDEMINDGIDLDLDLYVEHHFASYDFKSLEKLAVDLYELGYDVTDADEFIDERNKTVFCFDAIIETKITEENLLKQQSSFMPLVKKYHAFYDGWGVDFENEYID